VDAAGQLANGQHGVVSILGVVGQQGSVVRVGEARVQDGSIVPMSAKNGAQRLERSLGPELVVQIVDDAEVNEGVATGQEEAKLGKLAKIEQIELQVHAHEHVRPREPVAQEPPIVGPVHAQHHGVVRFQMAQACDRDFFSNVFL
jgi:hypothetical protein